MPNRKTLLLGNGINFLGRSGKSWEDVLRASAQFVGKPSIMSGWDQKALPLLYEELYSQHVGRKKLKEIDLKHFVAEQMAKVESNEFHPQIIESGVKNVITTNYDLALELGGSSKSQKDDLKDESKYSRYRRNKVDETYIWHIHGACDTPNTIQLGHEHYSGQLQYLRNMVVAIDTKKHNETKSAFLQGVRNFENVGIRYSWLDIFFRDDIHVLGLGMDFSEIDLWWAIAYKNRLKNGENRKKKQDQGIDLKFGSTTYHSLEKAAENSNEKARQDILRSLGVKVETHSNDEGYEGMYTNVIANLGQRP